MHNKIFSIAITLAALVTSPGLAQSVTSRLIYSGRALAEGVDTARTNAVRNALRERFRIDQNFLESLGKVCLTAGMPLKNPRDRAEIESRFNEAALGSDIDPYFFRNTPSSEIRAAFGKTYLSGLTHQWGKIILWHGDAKGLVIDFSIPEKTLNATNASVVFANMQNLPRDWNSAARPRYIPLIISTKEETSFLILNEVSSSANNPQISLYCPRFIVLSDSRGWTEPPYKMGVIKAADVYWDYCSADSNGHYQVYCNNFEGVSENIDDTKIEWQIGTRSKPIILR